MFDQILAAVKTLAVAHASPFTAIENGSLPQENGLSIYPGPGFPTDNYLDRGTDYSVPVVLNGKHSNLQTLLTAMSNIHSGLSRAASYPNTDDWQILDIESATPPHYLDREQSGTRQWLYGSILSVKFHIKGE